MKRMPGGWDKGIWMNEKCKRKLVIDSPWTQSSPDDSLNSLKFPSRCYENECLDIFTMRAATRASASVVSLVTFSGDKKMLQGTGTVINEDGIVLTSAKLVTCPSSENVLIENVKVIVYLWDGNFFEAKLLAYDFYYCIAFVKIQKDVALLKPACLRLVVDCITVDPSKLHISDYMGSQLRPGDKVVALGRYFVKPYDLMAAPGEFSITRCDGDFQCKELFRATCLMTTTGIGGPLINHHGEVIGVTSYAYHFTPFLPINIALKWWEEWKKSGLRRHPSLRMELANLHTTSLILLEMIDKKIPGKLAGVIVETVEQGSFADNAGIRQHDLIVACGGKTVRSFLELFDIIWDKTGDLVELTVLRASANAELNHTVEVVDAVH